MRKTAPSGRGAALDVVERLMVGERLAVAGVDRGAVVGVDALEEVLVAGLDRPRLEPVDPEELVRPGDLVLRDVPLPAAEPGEPLRLGELLGRPPQLALDPQLLGQVAGDARPRAPSRRSPSCPSVTWAGNTLPSRRLPSQHEPVRRPRAAARAQRQPRQQVGRRRAVDLGRRIAEGVEGGGVGVQQPRPPASATKSGSRIASPRRSANARGSFVRTSANRAPSGVLPPESPRAVPGGATDLHFVQAVSHRATPLRLSVYAE